MSIEYVNIYLCKIDIGFSYATDDLSSATSLIVELYGDGVSGWGEVLFPKIELPWQWACRVCPLLLGQDANFLDELIDLWPRDRRKLCLNDCSTYCHPDVDLVAEAVSIALHDLVGRLRGLPVCELLGEVSRYCIPGMPVVQLSEAGTMGSNAQKWIAGGYKYIKVKLTGRTHNDIEIIKTVYDRIGAGVSVQVDANGSYTDIDQAKPLIAVLNEYGVDVVEDIFDIGQMDLCRAARELTEGKYMVDKDAHWPNVVNVLECNAADMINQHPHNQGRLTYALKINDAATKAGIETAIGSSGVFGIQDAAYQHLAAVIGLSRPCEDIGLMPYFEGPTAGQYNFSHAPTVLDSQPVISDGNIIIGKESGLGIIIDRDALEKFTIRSEHFGA